MATTTGTRYDYCRAHGFDRVMGGEICEYVQTAVVRGERVTAEDACEWACPGCGHVADDHGYNRREVLDGFCADCQICQDDTTDAWDETRGVRA